MTRWTALKGQVSDAIGVGHDILHLSLGLLILFVLAYLLRHRRHCLLLAFCGLAVLQIINEVLDAVQWVMWTGQIAWGEAASDTAITLAVPFALVAVAALARTVRPSLAGPRATRADEPASLPERVTSRS